MKHERQYLRQTQHLWPSKQSKYNRVSDTFIWISAVMLGIGLPLSVYLVLNWINGI